MSNQLLLHFLWLLFQSDLHFSSSNFSYYFLAEIYVLPAAVMEIIPGHLSTSEVVDSAVFQRSGDYPINFPSYLDVAFASSLLPRQHAAWEGFWRDKVAS